GEGRRVDEFLESSMAAFLDSLVLPSVCAFLLRSECPIAARLSGLAAQRFWPAVDGGLVRQDKALRLPFTGVLAVKASARSWPCQIAQAGTARTPANGRWRG